MANDDTFRPRQRLDPEALRDICRIKSSADVLDLVGFGDEMTDWSNRAAELGQTIVPKTVYITQLYEQYEHRVAWVYHSWREEDEVVDQHHIACDCVASLEDPDEQIGEIVNCPAVLAAVEYRARTVAETLGTDEILGFYGKKGTEMKRSAIVSAKSMINFVMNYDKSHPEGWIGNLVSGEHQVPLLATIMRLPLENDPDRPHLVSTEEVIGEMDQDGSIILHDDGVTVELPEAA